MKFFAGKKLMAVLFAAVLSVSMVGCGNKNEEDNNIENSAKYVYVPEFIDVNFPEDSYQQNLTVIGEEIYYVEYEWNEETQVNSSVLYHRAIESQEEAVGINLPLEESESIIHFLVDADNNIILITNLYGGYDIETGAEGESNYFIKKMDQNGIELFSVDITDLISKEEMNSYVQYSIQDESGNIYLSNGETIWMFDIEGTFVSEISISSNWIQGFGKDKIGNVYIIQYGNEGMELAQIDPLKKAIGNSYKNLPSINNNNSVVPGMEEDFLISDGSKLYEYDLETQTAEEVLYFTDCDINGNNVEQLVPFSSEKILVVLRDWNSGNGTEIAYLNKTDASEVVQKETIILGTLYENSDLQEKIVEFNKASEQYRIKIQSYYDINSTSQSAWNDGITALNNAITSDNCPDILDLSQLNVSAYASKGLIEDLGTYLDNSETLSREDFVPSVLEAYTLNGSLVCIPNQFYISTLAGRQSQLGDSIGWNIDEFIAFAEANPETDLLDYGNTKSTILSYILQYNYDAFIDWSTGSCNFDSEEFKKILEFANRFALEEEFDESVSTPTKIQEGKILLTNLYLSDVQAYQMQELMFGEPMTCIGYPTVDGQLGTQIQGDGLYGIVSKSENKEAAWQFLELILAEDDSEYKSYYAFPSRTDELEAMFEEAMREEYSLDENGTPMLDENGEEIKYPKTSWSYDDFSADIYAATTEQIDAIKKIIEHASPVLSNDSTVSEMIYTEALPYFEGQKSVDEVAKVIQSRVQIYVSENS